MAAFVLVRMLLMASASDGLSPVPALSFFLVLGIGICEDLFEAWGGSRQIVGTAPVLPRLTELFKHLLWLRKKGVGHGSIKNVLFDSAESRSGEIFCRGSNVSSEHWSVRRPLSKLFAAAGRWVFGSSCAKGILMVEEQLRDVRMFCERYASLWHMERRDSLDALRNVCPHTST